MLHYTVIIGVIIIIIALQSHFFVKAKQRLRVLKTIFPSDNHIELQREEDTNVPYIQTHVKKGVINAVFVDIITTLNKYLKKNAETANDFHLIKDIIDRNCDGVEEEIRTLTPIPLYLGLIGTMSGILVGVIFLVFFGDGLDLIVNAGTDSSTEGIGELLGGVAIAMISSIFGIFYTIRCSIILKAAKNQMNVSRNAFLSWIQINLLPTLNESAVSAIYILQNNLTSFNKAFADNVRSMEVAFSQMSTSYENQLQFIQTIENLDVQQMATANITILQELQRSTSKFEKFNSYLTNVGDYLDQVARLNTSLNEHLNRTKVIEDMSTYFKQETEQIELRKEAVRESVQNLDNYFQLSLKKLEENNESQLTVFTDKLNHQYEFVTKSIEAQEAQLLETLTDLQSKYETALTNNGELVANNNNKVNEIVNSLNGISEIKKDIFSVCEAIATQNNNVEKLIEVMYLQGNTEMPIKQNRKQHLSIAKIGQVTLYSIIGIAAIIYIAEKLYSLILLIKL